VKVPQVRFSRRRQAEKHGFAYKVKAASPIARHHPTMIDLESTGRHDPDIRVPPLKPPNLVDKSNPPDVAGWSQEFVEWLGLVALGSARVLANDDVDSNLSRWTFPEGTSEQATPIRIFQWEGMVDAGWVTQLLITCM
jgi:Ribonuclease P 40kDa (Rpp40) subunit